MLRIPCPYCGVRDEPEFIFGGPAHVTRPGPEVDDATWTRYLYERDNPAGLHFERWLHAHKDWWDKDLKNVPQQIGAALRDESFYTQAISPGAAVVNFNALPIASPAAATNRYTYRMGIDTRSTAPSSPRVT